MPTDDFRWDEPPSELLLELQQTLRLRGADAVLTELSALQQEGKSAQIWHFEGELQHGHLNRPDVALPLFRKAVAEQPNLVRYVCSLATCLCDAERSEEALVLLSRLPATERDRPEILHAAALACKGAKNFTEHVAVLRRLCKLDPSNDDCVIELATGLARIGRNDEAIEVARQAVAEDPSSSKRLKSLGDQLLASGQVSESIEAYDRCLKADPDQLKLRGQVMLYRMCATQHSRSDLIRYGREWERLYTPDETVRSHPNSPDPDRRLKLGYVSGDFMWHSVSYFFYLPLLHRNREQFEVFCYSNTPKPDSRTEAIRHEADHWRDITELSDDDAEQLIRDDGIDILLDMTGHMPRNRLPLFARRPAPVQIGWQGYIGSRFVSALDYWVTDEIADPVDEELPPECGTPLRIPGGYHLYEPDPEAMAPLPPLPADRNKCITFGCFNNHAKYEPITIELWARVLKEVQGSRLLLKSGGFDDPSIVRLYQQQFESCGVDADRIRFLSATIVRQQHYEAYWHVDIGLDTFPHHGVTTTCEALWMGIPVVVLLGDRTESRVGASLLHQMRLQDWIAASPDDYVRIAAEASNDRGRIRELRETMRDQLKKSQLGDPAMNVLKYEAELRNVWTHWCRSQSGPLEIQSRSTT